MVKQSTKLFLLEDYTVYAPELTLQSLHDNCLTGGNHTGPRPEGSLRLIHPGSHCSSHRHSIRYIGPSTSGL